MINAFCFFPITEARYLLSIYLWFTYTSILYNNQKLYVSPALFLLLLFISLSVCCVSLSYCCRMRMYDDFETDTAVS